MNTLFDLPPKQPPPPPREETDAVEKRVFRRNLIGVAVGHALILLALFIVGMLRPKVKQEEVVWLNEGALGGGESAAIAEPESEPEPEIAEPEPPKPEMEKVIPEPTPPPEEKAPASEIVERKATPAPATPKPATPKPTTPKPATPKPATPKATPKAPPKATPKATPKSKATPAASPKPKAESSQKTKSETAKKTAGTPGTAKKDGEKTGAAAKGTATNPGATSGGTGEGTGKGKTGTGKDATSQFGWYTEMLRDRYYSRWDQPIGIGQDVIATVRLRILKDGTIAKHEIAKSSGNPQMDESVLTALEKVKQIDPLPAGLGNGEFFEINVNFKVGG